MKTLPVLVLSLTLLTVFSETSPILMEKQAKQLLRSRRQDRPSKPGFPDEPMRVLIKSRGASVRSGMEHGFPAQYQCWIRFLERPRDAAGVQWYLNLPTPQLKQSLHLSLSSSWDPTERSGTYSAASGIWMGL
ncbi:uncharacterized protein C17orf67 homolog isoform X1 [Macaca nemestrina]|uniref:uncharacterized protein C17orf67 homolog isoform X1 n=1 Tax=Macaca nemestrina TaxID=9545 RepID=UPI0039B90AA9